MARDLHLGAIAITDHDTVDGAKDALCCGIPSTLKFLTGVEISTNPPPSFPIQGSLHILGYGIRLDDPDLNETLQRLKEARNNRNPEIIERLLSLGFNISMDEFSNNEELQQLGRPHIAEMMVEKGFVQSIDEAFDEFLGNGKPAYVDKYRVACNRAIEMIKRAGGIAVLAHPFLVHNLGDKVLERLITTLVSAGLEGIEVYYPQHSPNHIARFEELATQYGLLMTGGTDFHGDLKPEIKMGSGHGDLLVPYQLYEKIYKACAA